MNVCNLPIDTAEIYFGRVKLLPFGKINSFESAGVRSNVGVPVIIDAGEAPFNNTFRFENLECRLAIISTVQTHLTKDF